MATLQTILQVSQNYYMSGGSDRVFLETCQMLEQRGHRVIPFAGESPQNQASEWADYFPPAVDFANPGPRDLSRFIYSRPAYQSITRLLEAVRPDIAHLHIYYGKLTGSILQPLEQAGVPIVQTLHEYKLICPVYTLVSDGRICEACRGGQFWRALPRRCNRHSLSRTALSVVETYVSRYLGAVDKIDRFFAVSDFLRQKMIEHGIPARKISTLHNFVDCSQVQPGNQVGEYFLFFGRIEPVKGIFTLLAAVSGLNVPLLIVGEGSASAEVAAYIRRHRFANVRLEGFRAKEDLQQLLRGAICTIVPSEWYEPLGLVVLESFAAGVPVLASNIGGIPEIVVDGVDGLLVEPGNVEQLREGMKWFVAKRDTAVKMGLAGREKMEKQFDVPIYYEKLLRLYREVIGGR